MEKRGGSFSSDSSMICGGRTFVAHIAIAIFIIAFFVILTAYVTPDWLRVDEDRAPSSTKFQKLGLWMSCYSNLHDPYYYDPYLSNAYNGCRWIYYPVTATFSDIREFILPGFMVPVQIAFSLCFGLGLIALILVILYLAKFTSQDEGTVHYLIVLGMLINASALFGTVAVIVFGALSSNRQWAIEWQFNYLSWGFICAVVGVVLEHLAGIFFLLEAILQWRKRETRATGSSYLRSPVFGSFRGGKTMKG